MIFSPSDIITSIKKFCCFIGATISPLIYSSDSNYSSMSFPSCSNTIWNIVLVKNTEQHFTVPVGAAKVIIRSNTLLNGNGSNATGGGNYYSLIGNSAVRATIPTVNNLLTGSGINVLGYTIRSYDTTISFIADQNTILSLSFYS